MIDEFQNRSSRRGSAGQETTEVDSGGKAFVKPRGSAPSRTQVGGYGKKKTFPHHLVNEFIKFMRELRDTRGTMGTFFEP